MNQSIFITGTNTDIGKTFVSAMLLSAAISHQLDIKYFKPIQAGSPSDCEKVKLLTNCEDKYIIPPVYTFSLPAAPYLAARAENKKVDQQKIHQRFQEISHTPCIVEGAGGLLVPLCDKVLVRDLVQTLNIPIIIVASTTLGTMNHTLLTIESALHAGITIKGIILSGPAYPNLIEVLQHFSSAPILAEVPYITEQDFHTNFHRQAAQIFYPERLIEIFS